jgi:uncharacterized RmlC-like cupin family protein
MKVAERRITERGLRRRAAGRCALVRPEPGSMTRQGLPKFAGISVEQGATGLCMHLVTVPPGGSARPHFHRDHESAIYLLEGSAETVWWDEEGNRHSIVQVPGEFLYIPANVPHQVFNLSQDQPARAVIARTDPNEQESVELWEPPSQ